MNMENNTLKLGLIAATTNITIETLNATFPREEEEIFQRYMRGFDVSKYHSDVNNPNGDYNNDIQHRSLVYLPEVPENPPDGFQAPVRIDRILDIKSGCDQGSNCLLIISAVNVLLEAGDDENEIKKAVTNGLNDSWGDGSFNAAIPEGTVICPVTEEEAQGDSRLSVRLGSITFVDP